MDKGSSCSKMVSGSSTQTLLWTALIKPGQKDTAQEAFEALQGLSEAQQQEALEYILALSENGLKARKGA